MWYNIKKKKPTDKVRYANKYGVCVLGTDGKQQPIEVLYSWNNQSFYVWDIKGDLMEADWITYWTPKPKLPYRAK